MDLSYIINPLTNKKVKSTGRLGRHLIANYHDYHDRIYNPSSGKFVKVIGTIGKKLLKHYRIYIQKGAGDASTPTGETECVDLCNDDQSCSSAESSIKSGMGEVFFFKKTDNNGYSVLKAPLKTNSSEIDKDLAYIAGASGEKFKYVVKMERCEGTPIKIKMEKLKGVVPSETTNSTLQGLHETCKDLMRALHYLHTTNLYAHFDIKPENIMVREENNANGNKKEKLVFIDMGLSEKFESTIGTLPDDYGHTPHYTSPCAYDGLKFCQGRDYWALGCTLYELITGNKFCDFSTPMQVIGFVCGDFNMGVLDYLLGLSKSENKPDALTKAKYQRLLTNRDIFLRKLNNTDANFESDLLKIDSTNKTVGNIFKPRFFIKNLIRELFRPSFEYYSNPSMNANSTPSTGGNKVATVDCVKAAKVACVETTKVAGVEKTNLECVTEKIRENLYNNWNRTVPKGQNVNCDLKGATDEKVLTKLAERRVKRQNMMPPNQPPKETEAMNQLLKDVDIGTNTGQSGGELNRKKLNNKNVLK